MAEYALVENGEVTQVIVADSEVIKSYGGEWVRVKLESGDKAGIGQLRDVQNDTFKFPVSNAEPDPNWPPKKTP